MEAHDDDGGMVDLFERAREGDRMAFRRLVEATHGDLHGYVAAMARNPAVAEEVVQDSYIILFERIGQVFDGATLLPWLKGVARHRLHEIWRDQRARARHQPDPLAMLAAQRSQGGEPEEHLAERLKACLARLPAQARDLLERHHLHGVPLTRLAGELGVAVGVVAMRLCRVRAGLRDCIRRQEGARHA